jgi:hypothetical protein
MTALLQTLVKCLEKTRGAGRGSLNQHHEKPPNFLKHEENKAETNSINF